MLTPIARRKDAVAAFEEAQVVATAVAGTRDWVNTPPNDLRPPAFADAGAPRTDKATGPLRARSRSRCSTTSALAELGCGGILGVGQGLRRAAAAGAARLRAQGRAPATSRWSARASPSTPAA